MELCIGALKRLMFHADTRAGGRPQINDGKTPSINQDSVATAVKNSFTACSGVYETDATGDGTDFMPFQTGEVSLLNLRSIPA